MEGEGRVGRSGMGRDTTFDCQCLIAVRGVGWCIWNDRSEEEGLCGKCILCLCTVRASVWKFFIRA